MDLFQDTILVFVTILWLMSLGVVLYYFVLVGFITMMFSFYMFTKARIYKLPNRKNLSVMDISYIFELKKIGYKGWKEISPDYAKMLVQEHKARVD